MKQVDVDTTGRRSSLSDGGTGTRQLRKTREEIRLLVAYALRNLGKPDLLEESELVDILRIEPGETESYFARGLALAEILRKAAEAAIERTARIHRFQRHRALLMAVLQGGSIASWARSVGLSREHVSRCLWRGATALVARELLGLSAPC